MGPKKDQKIQQAPKEPQPQPQPHQIHGYGRFQYLNGVRYQGEWKIINGVKTKHGFGSLVLPQGESYQGDWVEDVMQGFGIYKYADGSEYKGEWSKNKQHGNGRLQFANGTQYQGQWREHVMHGEGLFRDHLGRQWQGQYRQGRFYSRKQKELVRQKILAERQKTIIAQVKQTVLDLISQLQKNGNLLPFFDLLGSSRQLLSGRLAESSQLSNQKWIEVLKESASWQYRVLKSRKQVTLLDEKRVLANQFQGRGQLVEVVSQKQNGICFLQLQSAKWILVWAKE